MANQGSEKYTDETALRSVRDRIEHLFETGRCTEIIELCTDVLSSLPDEWKFYYHRAQAKLLLGDRSGAIDDLTIAIRIRPMEPTLYFFRGSWRVDAGEYVEGTDDLMQSINAETDQGTSYYVESARFRRAVAFLQLGEFEKAEKECLQVRATLTAHVRGRLWSASEVLDRAKRRAPP
jgi:tetratricopeptide (TPR) repeat protein